MLQKEQFPSHDLDGRKRVISWEIEQVTALKTPMGFDLTTRQKLFFGVTKSMRAMGFHEQYFGIFFEYE
jgi:hypothetical protein